MVVFQQLGGWDKPNPSPSRLSSKVPKPLIALKGLMLKSELDERKKVRAPLEPKRSPFVGDDSASLNA